MADIIEKIVRSFLWLGAEDIERDQLASWEICCSPRRKGAFGLGRS